MKGVLVAKSVVLFVESGLREFVKMRLALVGPNCFFASLTASRLMFALTLVSWVASRSLWFVRLYLGEFFSVGRVIFIPISW